MQPRSHYSGMWMTTTSRWVISYQIVDGKWHSCSSHVWLLQLLQAATVGTTLEISATYSITDENVMDGDTTNNQRTVSHHPANWLARPFFQLSMLCVVRVLHGSWQSGVEQLCYMTVLIMCR